MRNIKKLVIFAIPAILVGLMVAATVNAGWFTSDSSNKKETERVEQQQAIYVDSQPIPAFDWSLERHILIELYKARNDAVTTYAYVRNWQGEVYFSCKSIGFPIPANTQLTNPEIATSDDKDGFDAGAGGLTSIPQPEPNGTFTSPSTVGTYVFCLNEDGTISPSYFEDSVETHLSPLNSQGNGLKGDPELKIEANK